jgi:hypothetical protein
MTTKYKPTPMGKHGLLLRDRVRMSRRAKKKHAQGTPSCRLADRLKKREKREGDESSSSDSDSNERSDSEIEESSQDDSTSEDETREGVSTDATI